MSTELLCSVLGNREEIETFRKFSQGPGLNEDVR